MNKALFSVVSVTIYLVIYVSLISLGGFFNLTFYMLIASPVLILWMVLTVLKDPYNYPELEEGEEWGYRDKVKEDLDII